MAYTMGGWKGRERKADDGGKERCVNSKIHRRRRTRRWARRRRGIRIRKGEEEGGNIKKEGRDSSKCSHV